MTCRSRHDYIINQFNWVSFTFNACRFFTLPADEATDCTPLRSWVVSSPQFRLTARVSPHPLPTYAFRTMGSVSSLISGDSLNSNQCPAPDYRLKKGKSSQRKSGGCSLDGLLKCSFSSNTHPSKRLSHSRSGRSEDFFYIKVSKLCCLVKPFSRIQSRWSHLQKCLTSFKVSHKPRSVYPRAPSMEGGHLAGKRREGESEGRLQPTLLLMPGKKTEMVRRFSSRRFYWCELMTFPGCDPTSAPGQLGWAASSRMILTH